MTELVVVGVRAQEQNMFMVPQQLWVMSVDWQSCCDDVFEAGADEAAQGDDLKRRRGKASSRFDQQSVCAILSSKHTGRVPGEVNLTELQDKVSGLGSSPFPKSAFFILPQRRR